MLCNQIKEWYARQIKISTTVILVVQAVRKTSQTFTMSRVDFEESVPAGTREWTRWILTNVITTAIITIFTLINIYTIREIVWKVVSRSAGTVMSTRNVCTVLFTSSIVQPAFVHIWKSWFFKYLIQVKPWLTQLKKKVLTSKTEFSLFRN